MIADAVAFYPVQPVNTRRGVTLLQGCNRLRIKRVVASACSLDGPALISVDGTGDLPGACPMAASG